MEILHKSYCESQIPAYALKQGGYCGNRYSLRGKVRCLLKTAVFLYHIIGKSFGIPYDIKKASGRDRTAAEWKMAAKGKTLMKNGLENHYIIKDNKKLYFGYTTGSCAAGAAKAAAVMLFTGQDIRQADLMTPRGILLHLEVEDIRREQGQVSCAIRKDGGDDPDATHGMLVYASVKSPKGTGISIDGGAGVGRVTRKGLEQPVGAAAINRVPRQMIRESVEEVCQEHGYQGGVEVVISIPGGRRAQKTFNPRLGIEEGSLSWETSGIVVPMSEEALIASIRLEMEMHHAQGREYLLITPRKLQGRSL